MTTLLGPVLAVALMSQLHGGTIQGKVVDEAGKPVLGAQVVFFVPPPLDGNADPVEVQTNTKQGGQFRLATPLLGRDYILRANIWAYQPGSAIAAVPGYRPAAALGSQQEISYRNSGLIMRLHFGRDVDRSSRAAIGRKTRGSRRTPVS